MSKKSKMKRRLLSCLLVLAMVVTMVPITAFAQGDGSSKNNAIVVYRNPVDDPAGSKLPSASFEGIMEAASFKVRSSTVDAWAQQIVDASGVDSSKASEVQYYVQTMNLGNVNIKGGALGINYGAFFGWTAAKGGVAGDGSEDQVRIIASNGDVLAENLYVKVKGYVNVSWDVDGTVSSSKVSLDSTLATAEYNTAVTAVTEKTNQSEGKEYTFLGWDTDDNDKTIEILPEDAAAYFDKVVDVTDADSCVAAEDVDGVTFKAVFEKKTYTVTWADEDGSVIETDKKVAYGETPKFNGETPEKEAPADADYTYEFNGWSPAISPVTGDVTYKATYKESNKATYTVKFIDGKDAITETSVVEGKTVARPADPSKEGYKFAGWYADKDCKTEFDFEKAINENTDIYAKWLEVYTITFDANAEAVEGTMAPMYIDEGDTFELPECNFTYPGYKFVGWATDAKAAEEGILEGVQTVAGNMTLFAIWEEVPAVETTVTAKDVTVTYGAFTMNDIVAAAAPVVKTEDGDEVAGAVVTAKEDITRNNVGTYNVTLDYAGTVNTRAAVEYNGSTTQIKVTIQPAIGEVIVKSQNIKYGEEVVYPVTSTNNCKTIDVIVGIDVHDETSLVGTAQAAVPTEMILLLGLALNGTDIDLNDMSIEDLETVLKKAEGVDSTIDLGIAKLKEYEDSIRELIDTLKAVQAELPMDTELNISVVPEVLVMPENIGLYMIGSILADSNYTAESADGSNANMDAGYLIIAPNGIKTDLAWNDTDDNDIITLDKIAKFDFAAAAKIDESTLDGAEGFTDKGAQSHVEYLFIGVDGEGLVIDRCTDPKTAAEALTVGAYAQVAYVANWDNEMYYAEPIARPIVVSPNVADVDIIDANGNENYAQVYTYGDDIALKVTVDGKEAPVEGLTVKYIGSDTTVDGWYRDELPTDAGVYTVVATYTENDENGDLYKAGGAVGVLIINPADAEVGLSDSKYEYDGKQHFAELTNTGLDYVTVAIDRDENIAYVNMPEDTKAHVERIVAMLPAEAEDAVNEYFDKYAEFDGEVQTSTLKNETNDMLQAIIDADMTAAAKAEANELVNALVDELKNNEDVKELAAEIEADLEALKAKVGEEIPDEIEAELTQYIKDAVTVDEDGNVNIDTDKIEKDIDEMIAKVESELPASAVAELKEMKDEIVKAVENNIDVEAIETKLTEIKTTVEGLTEEDIAKLALKAAYEAYGYVDKDAVKDIAKEAIYKIEAQGYIDYAQNMLASIKGMYGGDIDTADLEAAIQKLIDDSKAAIEAGSIDADSLSTLETYIDNILKEMQGVVDQIPDGTIIFGQNPSEVGKYDCYAINISANYKAEFVEADLEIYEVTEEPGPDDPVGPTDPTEPIDPTEPTEPESPKDNETDTGDHTNMALPLLMATAALTAMAAVFATRRKHS